MAYSRGRARLLRHGARRAVFSQVATLHPRTHAPVFSLGLQCVWATLLTLSGSYSDLLDYVILLFCFSIS